MSCQTKEFTIFGVKYKTVQFSAVDGMEVLEHRDEISPAVILRQTFVEVDGVLVRLDDQAIEAHVLDVTGIIAPLMVLRGLIGVVRDFNFSFAMNWRGVRVPDRFISEARSVSSKYTTPMIAQICADGAATLRELEEYYSLNDAFKMFDIIMVKGVNAALANERAAKDAGRK